jgi:hypothetical protein
MAQKRWRPGDVVRKTLSDGWTYYARLLEVPWVAFYKHRAKEPGADLNEIVSKPVLFTLAVFKNFLAPGQWESIGNVRLNGSPAAPKAQAIYRFNSYSILDATGAMRPATRQECEGLEPAAVWEPNHIDDRLQDTFAGRPNIWLEQLLHPPGPPQ